jgi:hypothetical protein
MADNGKTAHLRLKLNVMQNVPSIWHEKFNEKDLQIQHKAINTPFFWEMKLKQFKI